jgi:hypothetical protein
MMLVDLHKLIEQARALSPEDKQRLRQAIDEEQPISPSGMRTEEDFKQHLQMAGLLKEVKPPVTDLAPYRERSPLEIAGEPVSETIIKERR